VKFGIFHDRPGSVRYSRILQSAVEQGLTDAANALRRVRAEYPACPTHGWLDDPIVGIADGQIAICCPFCSGEAVRKQWEDEGAA
jgi:hypothetical protein